MNLRSTALAVAGVLVMACAASAQITIYQHNFGGFGGALNGTAVDVGSANWAAGDTFFDDGVNTSVDAGGPNGQAAFLPFSPAAGNIYTASATVLNDNPNWIAFGLLPALPPGGDWTATDFSLRHSNNGAHAWVLTRNSSGNDQEAFGGANTANNFFGGDIVDPTSDVTIDIVLNTKAATWTAEYFLNGASQGVQNLPASANTGIGGIGFSRDRNDGGGNVANIRSMSLTFVPEPSTALLGLLAALGLACIRRRKN